jgi:drug/metabolite transporter (DMT)-like permease
LAGQKSCFTNKGEYFMSYDRKFLVFALGYIVLGMCLGIFMAASHDHGERPTHAHINLIGFVLSLSYGIMHKLWLVNASKIIAKTQFILHHAGAITIFVGLFLLYGNMMPEEKLDPVLAIGSITVLLSAILMFYMVLKTRAVKA